MYTIYPGCLIPLVDYSRNLYIARLSAGVAQQVEQLICNQPVGGSIPSASSTVTWHTHRLNRQSVSWWNSSIRGDTQAAKGGRL